jgi:histidinol-phosphate aminotransferase
MAVIIDTVSEPFNANRVGIAGALATLRKDREASVSAIQKIKDERCRLIDSLGEMGLDPIPSETNFVFFSTPFSAKDLSEALLEKGVIVRPCSGWGYQKSIRVTVGTPEENSVFLSTIASVLDEVRKDEQL